MRKDILMITLLMLAFFMPASAQKRKTARGKKVKVEAPAENPRFTEMLASTQKVFFVDSIVVNKEDLLNFICTNREEGCIATYNQFFKQVTANTNGYVYVNELGNKCIFSMNDANGHLRLYSCDLIGNEWSTPELLKGLENEGLVNLNYPYMMPDGLTLYFAAQGGDALGGYDIYKTRLDVESGQYLTPENIGLPFNSEANDFFYLISEQDSIGFFASTRLQPEGKVCVYTFIPSESRQIYDADAINGDKLRSYARIDHIGDTWTSELVKKNALNRQTRLRSLQSTRENKSEKGTFSFVINDQITYHRMQDFKDQENPNRMYELQNMQRQLAETDAALDKARTNYAKARASERPRLRTEILHNEKLQQTLLLQIKYLEKEIRNRELTN